MTYGFKLFNANGGVAVDCDYPVYQLKESGTITVTVQAGVLMATGNIAFSSPVTSQAPPIIALRWGAVDRVYCLATGIQGSPGAWTAWAGNFEGEVNATFTVEWRCYCTGLRSTTGYALQTRNGAGEICFDSSFAPLHLVAAVAPNNWVRIDAAAARWIIFNVTRVHDYFTAPQGDLFLVLSAMESAEVYAPGVMSAREHMAVFGYGFGPSNRIIRRSDVFYNVNAPNLLPTFGFPVLLGAA